MKKKLIAVFLLIALLLAGCSEKTGPLSVADAEKIVLDHAGVKRAESIHTHIVSGEENPCYSIHVTIQGTSYEYLVDAITGEILSYGEGGH